MTDKIELLPLVGTLRALPEHVQGVVQAYGHANVSHHTAALQAEVERLRRDVEEWENVASAQAELHDEAEEAAEKLAKALAELITWFPSADTYRRLGFDPEAPMRALERAKLLFGRGGQKEYGHG
jgi:hypothetical protein